jgi:hypothetical protein
MSLSDAYRDRHYAPGFVYIAGSFLGRVIKIGTTGDIGRQQYKLRYQQYGSLGDWAMLFYVWVDEAGRIEHDARRRLRRYQTLRMYWKDGSRQKAREIVQCTYSTALEALSCCITDVDRRSGWQSKRCSEYDFGSCDKDEPEANVITPTVKMPLSEPQPIDPIFFNKVDDLELSVRSANCLKNDNIIYLGQLVEKTEADMLRTPNFGRKSLNEIKEILAQMGLHLGMVVPGWTRAAFTKHIAGIAPSLLTHSSN